MTDDQLGYLISAIALIIVIIVVALYAMGFSDPL